MEMERRGQNEQHGKGSAGLGKRLKMGKEGGILVGSKASGLGVGLVDSPNKDTFSIWDILIKKMIFLTETQIQLGILYLKLT